MAKIAVGMSGGVDSSVAAALLQAAGHEVVGVTLALWRGSLCCSFEDVARAKEVARQLGIRHFLIEALDDFRSQIVEPFVVARLQGQTPNPCVWCNQLFKFGLLWEQLQQKDPEISALASGHYARLSLNPQTQRQEVFMGADPSKDQSYMLWRLSQSQLQRALFPLGALKKSQVREKAQALGLTELAQKPDSQDLCFVVPTADDFWQTHAPQGLIPGEIVHVDGQVHGTHSGRVKYTLGQRRGLGGGSTERLYVAGVDPVRNLVQVAPREQLLSARLSLAEVNWVSIPAPEAELRCLFKLSSQGVPVSGLLHLSSDKTATVQLDAPHMPVGQGQSVVFYDSTDRLLGGGILTQMRPNS
ncbi:MAG: tRNA 2-thiouridine(34) synthase MnmA [Candidatus Sericytochromatia bacterium]